MILVLGICAISSCMAGRCKETDGAEGEYRGMEVEHGEVYIGDVCGRDERKVEMQCNAERVGKEKLER